MRLFVNPHWIFNINLFVSPKNTVNITIFVSPNETVIIKLFVSPWPMGLSILPGQALCEGGGARGGIINIIRGSENLLQLRPSN
jgi:hypothetical protein